LADFEDGTADPEPVADADLVISQPIHREILAEAAANEIRSAKIILPIAIGSELIDHDGPLLAAVAGKIALTISDQVEPPGNDPAIDRRLPYPCSDGPAAPQHVLWQSDIDGDDGVHLGALCGACVGALRRTIRCCRGDDVAGDQCSQFLQAAMDVDL